MPNLQPSALMPAASEPFSWKFWPGAARTCTICDRKLRLQDVSEHRTVYPGGTVEFICRECFRARSETAKTRQGS